MRKSRFSETQSVSILKEHDAGALQNGSVESFNGRFRDELLNEHAFPSLSHARFAIEA